MGVKVTSIAQIPSDLDIAYYIYLLVSRFPYPSSRALERAFDIMAREAGTGDFVALQGTTHEFGGEVMNAYSVDGIPVDEILPAVLITSVNPHQFEQVRSIDTTGPFQPGERVVLISLRDENITEGYVFKLLEGIIADIRAGKELRNFSCATNKKSRFLDALILEPNFYGVGFKPKEIWDFLSGKQRRP